MNDETISKDQAWAGILDRLTWHASRGNLQSERIAVSHLVYQALNDGERTNFSQGITAFISGKQIDYAMRGPMRTEYHYLEVTLAKMSD